MVAVHLEPYRETLDISGDTGTVCLHRGQERLYERRLNTNRKELPIPFPFNQIHINHRQFSTCQSKELACQQSARKRA
jgi:hypothetical protein